MYIIYLIWCGNHINAPCYLKWPSQLLSCSTKCPCHLQQRPGRFLLSFRNLCATSYKMPYIGGNQKVKINAIVIQISFIIGLQIGNQRFHKSTWLWETIYICIRSKAIQSLLQLFIWGGGEKCNDCGMHVQQLMAWEINNMRLGIPLSRNQFTNKIGRTGGEPQLAQSNQLKHILKCLTTLK